VAAKKPSKKSAKKRRDKKPKLTKAEEALQKSEEALATIGALRTEIHSISINTNRSLKTFNEAFSNNDKTLCDYIDEVADKLHGMSRTLQEYTEVEARTLENHEMRLRVLEAQVAGDGTTAEAVVEGWSPRVDEEMLLRCANSARVDRIKAQEERAQEAERLKAEQEKLAKEQQERDSMKLDELSDEELAKATAEAAPSVAEDYAEGTQFFGGEGDED